MYYNIEGNPFIIRFKTLVLQYASKSDTCIYIEGNPFIIRFKTYLICGK